MRAYLHTETDDNDATYFAIHQLATMRKAIDAVHDYLTRKTEEQQQTERLMARSSALRTRLNHARSAPDARPAPPGRGIPRRQAISARTASCTRPHAPICSVSKALGLLARYKIGNAFRFTPVADLRERIEDLAASPSCPAS